MKFSFVDPFPEHYFSFFMNSESIREYWEETGYHPTSIETAWLIYSSFKLTFDEKCQFWECIAWKMPDMEVIRRPNCPHYDSLHAFLYRFMNISRRFLEWFNDNTDCVYTLKDADNDWPFDYAFSSVESIKEFIKTEECEDIESFVIKKISVDDYSKYPAKIIVDKEFEFICQERWNYGAFPCNEEEYDILIAFEGMWFDFPVPFKRGDVIYNPYYKCGIGTAEDYTDLFVVLDIVPKCLSEKRKKDYLEGRNGDTTDMSFGGYTQWRDGIVYRESFCNYMDFEFYHGEYKGFQRIIKALSNYEKGLINDELLMHAYHQILSEERARSDIPYFYTREGLELAGINIDKKDGA